jgi:hypothetical protein
VDVFFDCCRGCAEWRPCALLRCSLLPGQLNADRAGGGVDNDMAILNSSKGWTPGHAAAPHAFHDLPVYLRSEMWCVECLVCYKRCITTAPRPAQIKLLHAESTHDGRVLACSLQHHVESLSTIPCRDAGNKESCWGAK